MSKPHQYENLPHLELTDAARVLLGHIADKWSIVILCELCSGPLRFNALKRSVTGVTQKALTHALRRLERSGLVDRRILPGSPPAVEYSITDLGFSLAPPMRAVLSWTVERMPEVEQAQMRYDQAEADRG